MGRKGSIGYLRLEENRITKGVLNICSAYNIRLAVDRFDF